MTDNKPESELAEQESSLLPIDEHIEEFSENGKKVRRKGVYLLPNLFTTGALFSGFYAVLASQQGNFEGAAIAILIAMLCDGLDGRIARLTNTSSQFGVQYDSLSDLISFGLAPAVLIFNWSSIALGKFGWATCFIYTVCAALRLARFNTQVEVTDSRFFTGLASPAAAGTIAATVWVWHDIDVSLWVASLVAILMVFLGLLMVSNVKYSSFKGLDLRGRVPYYVMLAIVFFFAAITISPAEILLFTGLVYGFSGPIQWTWQRFFRVNTN